MVSFVQILAERALATDKAAVVVKKVESPVVEDEDEEPVYARPSCRLSSMFDDDSDDEDDQPASIWEPASPRFTSQSPFLSRPPGCACMRLTCMCLAPSMS